jgi:hypothetical protein
MADTDHPLRRGIRRSLGNQAAVRIRRAPHISAATRPWAVSLHEYTYVSGVALSAHAASRVIGNGASQAPGLDGQMPSTSLIDAICYSRCHAGWHRTRPPEPAQKYGSDLFRCHGLAPLDQICDLGIVLVLRSAQVYESDWILTVHDCAHSKEVGGRLHENIMH